MARNQQRQQPQHDSTADSDRQRDTYSKITLAAAIMLRAHQRRQAIKYREPWPADVIVDPRLVGQSRRVKGFTKPGLAEAVDAVADLVAGGLPVNRAAKVVASQMQRYWVPAWKRHAERSDDLASLGGDTLAQQLRVAYNRTRRSR